MHIMDNIVGIRIQLCDILHHFPVIVPDFFIIQHFICHRFNTRNHLHTHAFIYAAVYSQQQAFCQIAPRTEELHLLPDLHGGNAAGNCIIVTVNRPHNIIIFILNRIRCDGNFSTVTFECLRQMFAPQYRQVRFRRSAQIDQGMQVPERVFRNHGTAVDPDAANRFRNPCRIAAEQLIVFRRAQVAHQPQFNNKLIDELLCALFGQRPIFQIALNIDIQKSGGASQTGCGTVVFLDTSKITHIDRLHSFLCGFCRFGNIHLIGSSHFSNFFQGTNLLADLFAQADALFIHRAIQFTKVFFLLFN